MDLRTTCKVRCVVGSASLAHTPAAAWRATPHLLIFPQQPDDPRSGPLAEFLGEAKSKIEELSTLLAEREEEFYSFKNDVRFSPHARPLTLAVPSPASDLARFVPGQEGDDYDDEAESTDGVDNIDYADDEEDDEEDVGSEDRKARLEVPPIPAPPHLSQHPAHRRGEARARTLALAGTQGQGAGQRREGGDVSLRSEQRPVHVCTCARARSAAATHTNPTSPCISYGVAGHSVSRPPFSSVSHT